MTTFANLNYAEITRTKVAARAGSREGVQYAHQSRGDLDANTLASTISRGHPLPDEGYINAGAALRERNVRAAFCDALNLAYARQVKKILSGVPVCNCGRYAEYHCTACSAPLCEKCGCPC